MNMSLALRLPRVRHLVDHLRMSHACHRFRKCYKTLTFCSLLTRCIIPCACHAKTASERPKVLRTRQFFTDFDFDVCFGPQRRVLFRYLNFQKWPEHAMFCTCLLRNVLRGTTARTFFDIATSKSGRKLRCFVHFDFEMCFAPQQRALFRHHNFQKWSEVVLFCTFWL